MLRLIVSLLAAFPAIGHAQDAGTLKWFERAWREAAEWEPPANTFFSYRIEAYVHVDPDELARLEREVEGHPEHPSRGRLANLRNLLNAGSPIVSDYRIWWAGPSDKGGWRYSRDSPKDAMQTYQDVVVTRDVSWSLHADKNGPKSLGIADPRNPPSGQTYRNYEPALRKHLSQIVLAELGQGATSSLAFAPTSVERDADRWVGVVASANGAREKVYSGLILGDSTVVIDEVVMRKSDDAPQFLGERSVFSDWSHDSFLARPVAHRVEGFDGKGNLQWRLTLLEIRPASESEIASVLRVPIDGAPDAIREQVSPRYITDARPSVRQMIVHDELGTRVDPLPALPDAKGNVLVRWMGWSALSGVVGLTF